MSAHAQRRRLLAAASLTLAMTAAPRSHADAVRARPADALVDSIGVNTHFGYTDRPYVRAFPAVKTKLGALGVRHIRDAADSRPDVARRINELHAAYGIRVLQGVGPRVDSPTPWRGKLDIARIDAVLGTLKTLYPESNEAIEGPNEYDVTHGHPAAALADPDWPATLRAYTEALWKKVRADPVLRTRPVLASPLAHAANAPKVGDLSAYITHGNMHPYPGGRQPTAALEDYNIANTRKISGTKPLWATETGYHNALKQKPGGHNAAPESVSARYGPRLVAEYFRLGIERTYFYEFLDEGADPADQENNFGLVRNDLGEKPIYRALQATIALLKDPAPRGYPPFTPGALDYRLEGDLTDVRQVLLQKRDGRFCLLLWQEVSGYDVSTRTLLSPPPRPVTLRLGAPARSATTYLPTTNATAATATFAAPKTLTLAVPDHLLIVELTPGPAAKPSP